MVSGDSLAYSQISEPHALSKDTRKKHAYKDMLLFCMLLTSYCFHFLLLDVLINLTVPGDY